MPETPGPHEQTPSGSYLGARIAALPPTTAEDLAVINARFARTPQKLEDIFTFPAVISTDAVDSYFTRMDPATTLPNFATDFAAGQSLLDTHDDRSVATILGRSFDAVLRPAPKLVEGAQATKEVAVRWYMTRDEGTALVIRRMLAGTIQAMSVGFGGNSLEIISEIDGRPLWESQYYPGQRLPDGRRSTFLVKHGHGMEGSLAYKNSTPGAGVRVAAVLARIEDLVSRREIDPGEAATFEGLWGVRFPGAPTLYRGWTGPRGDQPSPRQEGAMSYADLVQTRVGKTFSAKTRAALESFATKGGDIKDGLMALLADVVEEATADTTTRAQATLTEALAGVRVALSDVGLTLPIDQDVAAGVRSLQATLAEQRTLATDGRAYREALVAEALAEGVRAHGQAFAKDLYEPLLRTASLEVAKRMLADWRTAGDARLGAGRLSREPEGEQLPDGQKAPAVPVNLSAYRA